MALKNFYVIEDIRLLPPGRYNFRQLQHDEAVEQLRGKMWYWYIKGENGDTFYRLRDSLAHDSGVVDFMERKLDDPQRLQVGTGHLFLLIYDHHQRDENNQEVFSYHLFDVPKKGARQ